jgi:hypothetical protein
MASPGCRWLPFLLWFFASRLIHYRLCQRVYIHAFMIGKPVAKAMPETKAEKVARLRREAHATELGGRQLLNVAVLLVDGRAYDKAVPDARSMLAQAAKLRERADHIESEGQTEHPVDSN